MGKSIASVFNALNEAEEGRTVMHVSSASNRRDFSLGIAEQSLRDRGVEYVKKGTTIHIGAGWCLFADLSDDMISGRVAEILPTSRKGP